ncbi:MAG: guanylate kinase [Firmicutes bacterium]|nr:guanylate kinase [Bacillota bacterium]
MCDAGSGEGLLVVMSAPSGAGKGTLRRALIDDHPEIVFCPSVTTRQARPGERDGVDYHFVGVSEFEEMVVAGRFAEWARVYGNLYGTPRETLDNLLASGVTVLVEKDVQGAIALKRLYPEGIYVFVLPPSFEELKRRMRARGTETEADVERRLESYPGELQYVGQYDYVIVNEDLGRAKKDLEAIILGERARRCGCRAGS